MEPYYQQDGWRSADARGGREGGGMRRISEAWHRMVRHPRNGEPIVIIRNDLAGLRGHILNPHPGPDRKWLVVIADDYDLERWPAYQSGFQELSRWEFVRVDHGVKSWDEMKWEEIDARREAAG